MKVLINGKEVLLEKEITVKELLDVQNVEMKDYVTVQLNDEWVARENFETLVIREGDVVEFLYFMGGGAV